MSKLIKKLANTLLSLMLFSMTTGAIQAAPILMVSHSSAISMSSFANANQPGVNNTSKGGSGKSQSLAIKSSSQAAQLAKRQYSAKVLSVQSTKVGGSPGYRVKLLSNQGAVFYATVNARTGSVSRN
ncbi:PepSY domain-containing protein [Shewanella olleyana]|uniref:PepSY domain-containing protein n=1 Tax=Shewanella olleyana TaxID=135626 RepID=UPI00200C5CDC|nr:PepSY domain-containing protein [Shewanella olleyana]MCL1068508.1 PepSY domain-containing protein [Shewanella olleyana]